MTSAPDNSVIPVDNYSPIAHVAEPQREWEYLVGTSDIPSSLSYGIDKDGKIWLHFEFDEQGYLDTPLDDFLLIFRLFNMTWYSHVAKLLDICLNPSCHNKPNGGHQRKEDCVPMAEFQRDILERSELEMQRLRHSQSVKSAPPNGEVSLEPLPEP